MSKEPKASTPPADAAPKTEGAPATSATESAPAAGAARTSGETSVTEKAADAPRPDLGKTSDASSAAAGSSSSSSTGTPAGGGSTAGSGAANAGNGGANAGGGGQGGGGQGGFNGGSDRGRRSSGSNDLFGAEDLGLDAPPPGESGRRAAPVKAVVVGIGLVVLALLWYWSSLHHDKFYLSVDGERVTVRRGLYFPFGTSTFAPTGGYNSFALPSGLAPETLGPMSHEELDRVLRTLYVRIARLQLKDLDQGNPDKAEDMLRRALKLSFSSATDEVEVIELRGDVAFRRGLKEVRGIQERFDEALRQFRNAARQGGSEYTGAEKWVESISRLRDEFRQLALASNLDPDKILSSPVPVVPAGFMMPAVPTPPAANGGEGAKPTAPPKPATP